MGEKKHSINVLFTLALLGIFALSALFVAVLGAQVYERTAKQMDQNFNVRTSLVYLTEKVKQCPGKDIAVKDVEGEDALVLTQQIDKKAYETWIFSADGKLREVVVPQGQNVGAIDGQEIMDINNFGLSLDNGLLKITVLDDEGDNNSVLISTKS